MIAHPPAQPLPPAALPPLQVGSNMRIGKNSLGTWVEGPGGGMDFRHPFTVSTSKAGARISKGYILADIAVEPSIGGVPISGDKTRPQPLLKLSPALVNKAGESWVCVEVTPNAEGKLETEGEGEESKVEVVQRDLPVITEGETGRAPLALLVYAKDRWQAFAVAMFHYRYVTSLPADGKRKHFFL